MRLWRITKHENRVQRASQVETGQSVRQASVVGDCLKVGSLCDDTDPADKTDPRVSKGIPPGYPSDEKHINLEHGCGVASGCLPAAFWLLHWITSLRDQKKVDGCLNRREHKETCQQYVKWW
jgi:hypothetical protein